jgi:hypothetical protein
MPSHEEATDDPGKIMIYEYPTYTGEATMELDVAANKVSKYMAEFPDVFAGCHYTHDSSQLSVSIAKPEHAAVVGLRDLIGNLDADNELFIFEEVERSRKELQELQMAIVYEFMVEDPNGSENGLRTKEGTSIESVGYCDSPSRVVIGILKESKWAPLEDNAEVQAINAKYPGAVMFMESYPCTQPSATPGPDPRQET